MNALIALLHFCEIHGPRVVFCTQAIHQKNSSSSSVISANGSNGGVGSNGSSATTTDDYKSTNIVSPSTSEKTAPAVPAVPAAAAAAQKADSVFSTSSSAADPPTPPPTSNNSAFNNNAASNNPSMTATTTTTSPRASLRKCAPPPPPPPTTTTIPISKSYQSNTASTSSTTQPSSCPACLAQMPFVVKDEGGVVEAKRMVTIDEEDPSVEYIGTRAPQQLALYKAVRLACVRSLTTEFCPGREGPVLFGDDENGYVMSYMFKLRDAQARGEARFYSLMMLMTDRVFLISCWPFLVSSFRSMAINLQERADIVFQREKETRPQFHPFATSRRVGAMSQEQFFRRRSNTALRSLVELLGVKNIYPQIHAQFSYILKLSARRRMEKITPGRSASAAYLKMRDEYQLRRNNRKAAPREEEKDASVTTTTTAATARTMQAAALPTPISQYT
ncbi:vesicle coat protein [Zychaea mexicana]|uniref:vesicle coat protein n=1 Tax=Zychaea mexicana TaxID=64656 RepID=UPI0022FF285F|nr:vesicle coat protein [Zychaea mexicana]KAI9496519.1 vesicle coat protein [Zychaea mexicana]